MESVTNRNKKKVLPSPFSKIKLENGPLKNVHESFVRYISNNFYIIKLQLKILA